MQDRQKTQKGGITETKRRRENRVSNHFCMRKEREMKIWVISFASLLLCVSILSCGDDGTNLSQWACECTGFDTTFVCADNSNDAESQALAELCEGDPDCGCDCLDTHVMQGC